MSAPLDTMGRAAATFRPSFERHDARGVFTEVVRRGPWHTVITGTLRAGAVLGHHYHRRTRMAFHLVAGRTVIQVIDISDGARRRLELAPGDGVYLEPGQAHAIRAEEDCTFLLLKSQPYSEDDPDTYAFPVGGV